MIILKVSLLGFIFSLNIQTFQEVLDEKELKRIKYDVFKFGMNGFQKEKKQDTRVELAIKLGAKPPKKKVTGVCDVLLSRQLECRMYEKVDTFLC